MSREYNGRRKGSRNKGYFYRAGRGWFTKVNGQFVPLTDKAGARIKDENAKQAAKDAYARHLVECDERPQQTGDGKTVEQVVAYYLKHAERENRASTYKMRADTLFDFVYGFPSKWRKRVEDDPAVIGKLTKADKIHAGCGTMPVAELRRHHLETWLEAHPGWNDRRIRLQAVRRALTHAVNDGLIPKHQIDKFRIPAGRARVTFLTAEQQTALIVAARPAFKLVLKVLVRTGMRPNELARLTAEHVKDSGNRIELRFSGDESKNGKTRIVRITDSEIMEIIRTQMKLNRTGPIFRTQQGNPWQVSYMSQSFRRARKRAVKAGMTFDADSCIYSARHTYAKSMLLGVWTGTPISIDMLAPLMGNTVEVCRKHYADVTKENSGVEELLWRAV